MKKLNEVLIVMCCLFLFFSFCYGIVCIFLGVCKRVLLGIKRLPFFESVTTSQPIMEIGWCEHIIASSPLTLQLGIEIQDITTPLA